MCATLVVLSHSQLLEALVTQLREVGIDAHGVRSFEGGREQLNRHRWDVLLAAVRLEAYNGLQLAIRARLMQPNVAIILIGEVPDPAVEAEAAILRAQYVAGAGPEQLSEVVVAACRHAPTFTVPTPEVAEGGAGV